MLRTGKVLVTDLGGLGNQIFHSGDTVNERQFPLNNWEKLVEGKFIEEDPAKEISSDEEVETEIKPRELEEGEKLTEGAQSANADVQEIETELKVDEATDEPREKIGEINTDKKGADNNNKKRK